MLRHCKTLLFLSFISASVYSHPAGNIKAFIPADYEILDSKKGDLNRDSYPDLVLILKTKEENINGDLPRPLLLLAGTASGKYKFIARNDSVVLCKGCGGVFGDPYEGISIKNGFFSIEHYGGSSWRWTRIITFKYDIKSKVFKLHRDAGVSYHSAEQDKKLENLVHNKEDFGKLKFENYTNEKIFESGK